MSGYIKRDTNSTEQVSLIRKVSLIWKQSIFILRFFLINKTSWSRFNDDNKERDEKTEWFTNS